MFFLLKVFLANLCSLVACFFFFCGSWGLGGLSGWLRGFSVSCLLFFLRWLSFFVFITKEHT